MYQSTKVVDGFSTCFRQWKAEGTHCKFLHGYSIKFKIVFEGELDERNWVMDFGFMKRSESLMRLHILEDDYGFAHPGDWFKWFFDHTVVIAEDDPQIEYFKKLHNNDVIQLRILNKVGCEMFAEFVYDELSEWLQKEVGDRVKIVSVECIEHEKNSAIYKPE